MENGEEMLREKSIHAKNCEFFVFLPNDFTGVKPSCALSKKSIFRDAIEVKNEGNVCFKNKQYDSAISLYNKAIENMENFNQKLCSTELSICYQNRAAAEAEKKNYVASISDATKALAFNDTYSKAYFRRAKGYYMQKKYYLALQDIVQACILERFKNKTYNNMVTVIIAQIDLEPLDNQWQKAYKEMGSATLDCDDCKMKRIISLKTFGIIEPISVPIPKTQPATGFIRAMVGVKNNKSDEIIIGCDEEETAKGKYLEHSYILRAYMNTVVLISPTNTEKELPKDLYRLTELIADEKVSENIKYHARLCRANIYNRLHRFDDANRDLTLFETEHGHTALFHIIKSGALLHLALTNKQFLKPLSKCCEVLPKIYKLHFQKIFAESRCKSNRVLATAVLMSDLEDLIPRFPNELEPRMCLAGLYAKLNDKSMAKKILKKAKRDFPNRIQEMSTVYGMLNATHSSCVEYFKQALRLNKDDPGALKGLFNYFESTTYEYSKAIEVCTKSLVTYMETGDFKDFFEQRLVLLKKIIRQDFWDKL